MNLKRFLVLQLLDAAAVGKVLVGQEQEFLGQEAGEAPNDGGGDDQLLRPGGGKGGGVRMVQNGSCHAANLLDKEGCRQGVPRGVAGVEGLNLWFRERRRQKLPDQHLTESWMLKQGKKL